MTSWHKGNPLTWDTLLGSSKLLFALSIIRHSCVWTEASHYWADALILRLSSHCGVTQQLRDLTRFGDFELSTGVNPNHCHCLRGTTWSLARVTVHCGQFYASIILSDYYCLPLVVNTPLSVSVGVPLWASHVLRHSVSLPILHSWQVSFQTDSYTQPNESSPYIPVLLSLYDPF